MNNRVNWLLTIQELEKVKAAFQVVPLNYTSTLPTQDFLELVEFAKKAGFPPMQEQKSEG
jgi:hypothetical protein